MLYDITKSFEENITYGPFWTEKFPKLPKSRNKTKFLGFTLNSTLGIPACPLTGNARFVEVCSKLGFDLLTYKSVRSVEWHGNVFPHWYYINAPHVLVKKQIETFTTSVAPFPKQASSMANSFGIHSTKPEYWTRDFARAQENLLPGQALILSVQTTPQEGKTTVSDARDLARLALGAGAKIVEVNFACPNTEGGKGMIFEDVDLATRVCESMKKVLGKVPLLAKVGFYRTDETLREFLLRTRGILSGISSTNTFVGKIIDKKGNEAFPGRQNGGISGAVIRAISMEQAKKIISIKKELGLKQFVVIGIGGVTKPSHIDAYLRLGVDAVQSAVGSFEDPYLSYKYKKLHL